MPVHLNITLDESLYERLKRHTPPKKLSAFIAKAITRQLGPSEEELDLAYQKAAKDTDLDELAADWDSIKMEGWPEE